MDTEISSVKAFLQSRKLHASDEWIDGCIEWYKSENPLPVHASILNEAVLEQWLLLNLRDMEIGCLPEDLASFKMIILPGSFALQIEYIKDVSEAAYTQMQRIRKVDTTNEEVTREIPLAKPRRVLQLFMCDGLHEVVGMEYQPMKKINPYMTPGCKVLIKGPVKCRRGILLLTDDNIEILGGEIEDYLVKNSFENVLARMLGMPESDKPFTITQVNVNENEGIERRQNAIPPSIPSAVQNRNIQEQNRNQNPIQAFMPNVTVGHPPQRETINLVDNFDDDFDDDLDLNQIDQITELEYQSNTQKANKIATNDVKHDRNLTNQKSQSVASKPRPSASTISANIPVPKSNARTITSFFTTKNEPVKPEPDVNLDFGDEMDFDDNLLLEVPEIVPEVIQPESVLIYEIQTNRSKFIGQTIKVHAQFSTVVDKLKFDADGWMLRAEIKDDTGSVVVTFFNDVLERILGISKAEMIAVKKSKSFHAKEQAKEALKRAREKLLHLNGQFELEIRSENEVVAVRLP